MGVKEHPGHLGARPPHGRSVRGRSRRLRSSPIRRRCTGRSARVILAGHALVQTFGADTTSWRFTSPPTGEWRSRSTNGLGDLIPAEVGFQPGPGSAQRNSAGGDGLGGRSPPAAPPSTGSGSGRTLAESPWSPWQTWPTVPPCGRLLGWHQKPTPPERPPTPVGRSTSRDSRGHPPGFSHGHQPGSPWPPTGRFSWPLSDPKTRRAPP
jgi:hypothetical protein